MSTPPHWHEVQGLYAAAQSQVLLEASEAFAFDGGCLAVERTVTTQ